MYFWTWVVLIVTILCPILQTFAFVGVVEVTEVLSVVKIGVSLVEYIYKVFSSILVNDSSIQLY